MQRQLAATEEAVTEKGVLGAQLRDELNVHIQFTQVTSGWTVDSKLLKAKRDNMNIHLYDPHYSLMPSLCTAE